MSGWQPAKIHPSAQVHKTVVIYENVVIGENVFIGAYCIIGAPAEYKGREGMMAGVEIGKGTRITGMVTIDSGTTEPTKIGQNCYIMKHAHIGHDAIIGDEVTISCGAKIGGHATIHRQTNVGLNAVIHQHVVVPERCMIGASAFVGLKSNLIEGHKYAGVPVRMLGLNVKYSREEVKTDEGFDVAVYASSMMHNFTSNEIEAYTQGANFAKDWISKHRKP